MKKLLPLILILAVGVNAQWWITFTDTLYVNRTATGNGSGSDPANACVSGAQIQAFLNGKDFTSLGRLLILGSGPIINGSFAPTGYTCDNQSIPVFSVSAESRHGGIWDLIVKPFKNERNIK